MTPADISKAEGLILGGAGLDAVCGALGCTRRTLERAFVAAHGMTPARWRRAQAGTGTSGGASPVVAFRLAEYPALVKAAREAGVDPNAWAKATVQRALREND